MRIEKGYKSVAVPVKVVMNVCVQFQAGYDFNNRTTASLFLLRVSVQQTREGLRAIAL